MTANKPIMTQLTLRAPSWKNKYKHDVTTGPVTVYGEVVASDPRTVTLEFEVHDDWNHITVTKRITVERSRIMRSTRPIPLNLKETS